MKKKHRNITVNDQLYAWTVGFDDSFKIWKDGKVVHTGSFEDKLTPGSVRAIIEKNGY